MSTLLAICFVAFVILGVVAALGSGGQYERIGESALPAQSSNPPPDDLAEEARQLVLARNRRLVKRGEAPLDVEAEVARTLADLTRRPG
ncbi:MAG TPA: hypothetical protein VHU13_01840 [Solirubrobacteraceae bacterium]|nr:hypothetical protein [Solirubrobacteraceae bacterium]